MLKYLPPTIVLTLFIIGCSASYHAPGRAADFRALGITPEAQAAGAPTDINSAFNRKPLASFPAGVATVRIQEPGYESRTAQSYGHGAFSVVTTRDVESDQSIERLKKLPHVRGIAPVNRLLLPAQLNSAQELRHAAAQLQADMILIYTFDTTFHDRDLAAPLSVVTLGLSPTQATKVVTTASAVLMDTRNGYVYGIAEASHKKSGLATAWNAESAIDGDRQSTEREAFDKLVGQIETMWAGVVTEFGPNAARGAGKYPTGG
jgi:hypothetical protein